jgi:hypothetical protein
MSDVFPGFSYAYACRFNLPWETAPVTVYSAISTWTVRTAPFDGAFFACTVPPGLITGGGYTGAVDVTVSLNPCLTASGSAACVDSLPYTSAPVQFYYATAAITNLSVTLGPVRGGTVVTVQGTYFHLRDTGRLPAGYQHMPVLCRWGDVITTGEYVNVTQSVVCTSPLCTTAACLGVTLDACPMCFAPVRLEVALNGQDFTGSQTLFNYYKDPLIRRVFPTLGPTSGGTLITVFASGFGDPCLGCKTPEECQACQRLLVCRFMAFDRVVNVPARCLLLPDGTCDRSQLVCETPLGRPLRGNIVSLDPFNVAVSVSINSQQFFPVKITGAPYNVNDVRCTEGVSADCVFLFRYYEQPVIVSVHPSIIPGDGRGRVTVTGTNFLNVNDIRCRFGAYIGSRACQSGATDSVLPCSPYGCCVGASDKSAIFLSATTIICPTLDIRATLPAGAQLPSALSVGVSLNGQTGRNDFVYKLDALNQLQQDAVKVYWALSITPTLGVNDGGTRVTVTGVNFDAGGAMGDTRMRCKFGSIVITPDPTIVPDPVNFNGGRIECTAPGFPLDVAQGLTQQEVPFGICLLGVDCIYVGPLGQGDNVGTSQASIHHYTDNLRYLFYAAPRLSIILPRLGPTIGGTRITVTGTNFFATRVLVCRFDIGHFSTSATLLDSSRVVCLTPRMPSGVYKMDVTLNGQDYSAGCGSTGICEYTVFPEPTIVGIRPAAGINSGGTPVQVSVENPITNFQNLKCRFFAVSEDSRRRLSLHGVVTEVDAQLQGTTVTCITPRTISPISGASILTTPSAENPTAGLTVVQVATIPVHLFFSLFLFFYKSVFFCVIDFGSKLHT